MSNEKKYIPPAFPVAPPRQVNNDNLVYSDPGMTIRDYFAAKAIPALIDAAYDDLDKAAQDAYAIADAFLRAREL
jgi:hypothetical protein